MYHVSAQGIDERMINVHYYYYHYNCSFNSCAEQGDKDGVGKTPVEERFCSTTNQPL